MFSFRIIILLFLVVLYSCSNKTVKNLSKSEPVIFPSPPDTARIQFLKEIKNSSSIIKVRSKFKTIIFGQQQLSDFSKPYGICVKYGKIYVTDSGFKGIHIIDLEKSSFKTFIPKGFGELQLPINCFVDDDENLYVADGKRNQIVIFNRNGDYIDKIELLENFNPLDVNVYGDKVWVVNKASNCVNVFDKNNDHKLLYSFPETSRGSKDFLYSPTNLCVANDKVYVSDIGDSNIKCYTLDGQYINTFGGYGKEIGHFVRNKGVAVDKEENVFVVDAGFENVQIFNNDAQLLMYFGGPYTGPGYLWLPAKVFIDYDNIYYFEKYVDPSFNIKYLIFVTNQYGPDKITIYAAIEQSNALNTKKEPHKRKKRKRRWVRF